MARPLYVVQHLGQLFPNQSTTQPAAILVPLALELCHGRHFSVKQHPRPGLKVGDVIRPLCVLGQVAVYSHRRILHLALAGQHTAHMFLERLQPVTAVVEQFSGILCRQHASVKPPMQPKAPLDATRQRQRKARLPFSDALSDQHLASLAKLCVGKNAIPQRGQRRVPKRRIVETREVLEHVLTAHGVVVENVPLGEQIIVTVCHGRVEHGHVELARQRAVAILVALQAEEKQPCRLFPAAQQLSLARNPRLVVERVFVAHAPAHVDKHHLDALCSSSLAQVGQDFLLQHIALPVRVGKRRAHKHNQLAAGRLPILGSRDELWGQLAEHRCIS